jgi:hypothetical protein
MACLSAVPQIRIEKPPTAQGRQIHGDLRLSLRIFSEKAAQPVFSLVVFANTVATNSLLTWQPNSTITLKLPATTNCSWEAPDRVRFELGVCIPRRIILRRSARCRPVR